MATKNKYHIFLERLRRTGITNMYAASPYLCMQYRISAEEADSILSDWMNTYNEKDYKPEHTYFLVNTQRLKVNEAFINDVKSKDSNAVFIDEFLVAETVVFPKSWTKSADCGMYFAEAKRLGKKMLYVV